MEIAINWAELNEWIWKHQLSQTQMYSTDGFPIIIIAICHHRDQDELSISGYTILFQSFRIAHKLPGLYGYA